MRAPVLTVGDGTLGFWEALRDVFADTKEQAAKITNYLDALLAFYDFPGEHWIHIVICQWAVARRAVAP